MIKIIIVEGDDETLFIKSLLSWLRITDVEIFNAQGRNKFKAYIKSVLLEPDKVSNVSHLAVVGDAEDNAIASFQVIRTILSNLGYVTPNAKNVIASFQGVSTGIYIMPGDAESGMLEDLCMKIAVDKDKASAAKDFIDGVMDMPNPPQNYPKSFAQAYLSTMPISVPHVGVAALKGYWDFECDEILDLKNFLESFR